MPEFSPEQKIEQLRALVEADPSDHLGFFMLGKLYLDVNKPGDAAAQFESCLRLKPDYSAAYRLCGDAYRKAGEQEKARDVYTRGIAVAEENGDLQTVKEMKAFLGKLGG